MPFEGMKLDDQQRNKEDLINELFQLRKRNAELELNEMNLLKREREYLQIIDSSSEGSFINDLIKGEIYYSNEWKKRLGIENLSPREAVTASTTCVHPADRAIIHKAWRSACEQKSPKVKLEFRANTVDDGYIWILGQGKIFYDQEGNPVKYYGTHMDITERIQAEEQIREAHYNLEEIVKERTKEILLERQRLFDVLETLPVNIGLLTSDYHVIFANRAFRESFGENHNRRCYEYIFDLNEPCEFCQTYHVLETGKPHRWLLNSPDGRTHDIYGVPFTDVDGSSLILEMCIDLTEQRQAEEEMRQSEERFHKIFHNSPHMIAIIRMRDIRFLDVNQRFLDCSEYSREETLDRTPLELGILADDMKLAKYSLLELKERGEVKIDESRLRTKTGKTLIVSSSIVTMNLNNELCMVALMRDITREKKMEAEIARLDRLNLIGEMAASISHEIRNPMTSVRGFLQLLSGKEKYADDLTYFDLMIEELDRANEIITEYLGMAKDKLVELKLHSLDLIINYIYPIIKSDANNREIKVNLELSNPPDILVDEREIRQLILNMVRNGMESMTPPGILTIGTRMEGEEITLFIKDQGHGIAPEIQNKLGTPFLTTKDSGTGLGLAVCYSIAVRHDAIIDYETGLSGTTFYIRFPAPIREF